MLHPADLPPIHAAVPRHPVARDLLQTVAALAPEACNELAYRCFARDPELFAIPVVEAGVPLGLLRRHHVLERFARPFNRELYGKKSCRILMDPSALVVPDDLPVQALSARVVASGRTHLADGFIITQDGRYAGMGTGYDLMRIMTELQVQSARHANPLTGLPGNVPIAEETLRLLSAGRAFVVAYADLDWFKPYNDTYGYAAGDAVILRLSGLLEQHAHPQLDFIGHVGGDDFVLLMQSHDWEARLQAVLFDFGRTIGAHFSHAHRQAGGYGVMLRDGTTAFIGLTSVSIGALRVEPFVFHSHHEVAVRAAEAKKVAKQQPGNVLFVDRRLREEG